MRPCMPHVRLCFRRSNLRYHPIRSCHGLKIAVHACIQISASRVVVRMLSPLAVRLQESLLQQVASLETSAKRSDERWEELLATQRTSADAIFTRQRTQLETDLAQQQAEVKALQGRLTAAHEDM